MASNGATTTPETGSKQLRAPTPRQLARWKAIQQAQLQGLSMRATARLLGISRDTVSSYVRANGVPGRRNGVPASSNRRGDTDEVAAPLHWQNRCSSTIATAIGYVPPAEYEASQYCETVPAPAGTQ